MILNPTDIHVWCAFPDEIQEESLLSTYHTLMTSEEKVQQQRFHFAKHRHQYLITRALVRTTLSRYTDIKPYDWRFSKNKYGRPEILISQEIPPLRFNLSHTEGLIVCAVVLKEDIGIDVENITRKGATVEIADRFFSAQEIKDLHTVTNQHERFFEYWTLKESYIKARGMGLSLPLDQFSFHIPKGNESLNISFDSRLHDEPSQWQFWRINPTKQHKMAISFRKKEKVKLTIKKVIPTCEAKDRLL